MNALTVHLHLFSLLHFLRPTNAYKNTDGSRAFPPPTNSTGKTGKKIPRHPPTPINRDSPRKEKETIREEEILPVHRFQQKNSLARFFGGQINYYSRASYFDMGSHHGPPLSHAGGIAAFDLAQRRGQKKMPPSACMIGTSRTFFCCLVFRIISQRRPGGTAARPFV